MSIRDFTQTFIDYIKPGDRMLDLGAGEGKFTQMFLEHGARVTAVDIHPPTFQDAKLTVKKMAIEDFCASIGNESYNLVFARNTIQFLNKSWVLETFFPWLDEHLAQHGIVAIETFYQDPEPPFDHLMRSLYSLKELTSYFMNWREIYAKEYSHRGLDMSGQTRQFFVSILIAQKTN